MCDLDEWECPVHKRPDGSYAVLVYHCVHCKRVVFGPKSDDCPCGAELHPVSQYVKLGEMIQPHKLLETS